MGFADYLSRHPTSKAIPTSKDDENFVIKLMNSFKFLLKKADKISSNRILESSLEQNDVIHAQEQKQSKQYVFSHLLHTNQLQSSILISQNSKIVNVCTRNRPNRNTIEQTIIKRFHGSNKNNRSSNNISCKSPDITQRNKNNPGTPTVSISIGTQTEYSSNVGQGLKPLNPLKVKNPFDDES